MVSNSDYSTTQTTSRTDYYRDISPTIAHEFTNPYSIDKIDELFVPDMSKQDWEDMNSLELKYQGIRAVKSFQKYPNKVQAINKKYFLNPKIRNREKRTNPKFLNLKS